MLQFYLSFSKAVVTERATERHMDVEKHGRLKSKMEATGYMKFHRNSIEMHSARLDTS